MTRTSRFTAALLFGALAVSGVAQATGAPPKPKISMAKARAMALKLAPGKLMSSEYEKEGGGWRYSFDIRQGNRIHEIGVDANRGKIVEDKFEGLKDKD